MSFKRRLLKMVGAISAMVLVTLTIVACGSSGINGQVREAVLILGNLAEDAMTKPAGNSD